jgi:hypothetical protein
MGRIENPAGTTTILQGEIGPGALSGVNVQRQAGFMTRGYCQLCSCEYRYGGTTGWGNTPLAGGRRQREGCRRSLESPGSLSCVSMAHLSRGPGQYQVDVLPVAVKRVRLVVRVDDHDGSRYHQRREAMMRRILSLAATSISRPTSWHHQLHLQIQRFL